MTRRWMTLLAVLLIAPMAMAAKITIDYAKDAPLGTYKTFQYQESKKSGREKNPLMADRIKAGVIQMATDGGLQEVESDPDLVITYHVSSKEGFNLNSTGFGYGYGMGWGGGMGMSSTTVTSYTEGTLIVDAFDAAKDELVWRGTSTQVMKAQPDKQQKQLDKALAKMLATWEKMKAKAAAKSSGD